MSTRFPTPNLPTNMVDYQRALENSLTITEGAQSNTESVLRSMRQSVASNYGLGARLPTLPNSLSNKVYTDLQNLQASPAATVTLQRAWTNLGNAITINSPAFTSNLVVAVASAATLVITGGGGGGSFTQRFRVQVGSGLSANKMVSIVNFGQTLFTFDNVPPSTSFTVRMQVWGYIDTAGVISNGTIGTTSVYRVSTNVRAVALV